MSGRRSDGDGWAVQGRQLVCWQQGVQGDHRVGTNETRGDARARRRRGWDAMAAAWTTCRPRAVGWSGRGDHTLRAPDETLRKGDRRDACRGHDGRCAAQQRSVPCRWWTAKSRALVRHPLGLAGGRQAPRMGLEMSTTGRNLARPLRRGRNAQAANQSPAWGEVFLWELLFYC